MKWNAVMHIAFYTEQMNEMIRFYTEVLGGTVKVVTRFYQYLDRADRPQFQEIAKQKPNEIFNVYIELCDGQYVEFFPKMDNQLPHRKWNQDLGYSHFALTVDDIYATRKELEEKGLVLDTEISKGPSGTYQMWAHDPDQNKFEIMQYTEQSFQVVGHIDPEVNA